MRCLQNISNKLTESLFYNKEFELLKHTELVADGGLGFDFDAYQKLVPIHPVYNYTHYYINRPAISLKQLKRKIKEVCRYIKIVTANRSMVFLRHPLVVTYDIDFYTGKRYYTIVCRFSIREED